MNKTKKENLIFIDGWEHVHCPVCGTLVETYDICDVVIGKIREHLISMVVLIK